MDASTISFYETGARKPGIVNMERIAKALDIGVDALLNGDVVEERRARLAPELAEAVEAVRDLYEVLHWLQESGNIKSPIEPHPFGLAVVQAKQTARALLARIDKGDV